MFPVNASIKLDAHIIGNVKNAGHCRQSSHLAQKK